MSKPYVQPYLFFNGQCEEAIEFYRTTIGAQLQFMMRYGDSPDGSLPQGVKPGFENKVMHCTFHVGETAIMAADDCLGNPMFGGFRLSLAVPTIDEAQRSFAALAVGGQVQMPLEKTFWSPCFGMLTDKYGVGWMVTVQPTQN